MEGSTRETVPREELDKAYATIATLTAMLDRELSIIEKLSEGEVRVTKEEVAAAGKAEVRDEIPKAPYVDAEEVMRMLGCSRQLAYRRLREFGATSVGHKLIAKSPPSRCGLGGKGSLGSEHVAHAEGHPVGNHVVDERLEAGERHLEVLRGQGKDGDGWSPSWRLRKPTMRLTPADNKITTRESGTSGLTGYRSSYFLAPDGDIVGLGIANAQICVWDVCYRPRRQ